jgi:porin
MKKWSYLFLLVSMQLVQAQTDGTNASPFEFGASYVGEAMGVLHGGIQSGFSYEGMANIRFGFHTEKAGWWKGGSFLVTGANTHGGTPSSRLIGDFQVASNIEAGELTYLHECWYRQELGQLTLMVGLQDLNSEFVYTESGNAFLNSSFGTHSTIASNVPSPIFPLTSLGAQVQYRFSDRVLVKAAVFDGMPEDLDYNPHNISWHLNSNDGYLTFAELNLADPMPGLPGGVFKLGAYYHNHNPFSNVSDPSLPNYGAYLSADQTVLRLSSERKLNAFVQCSVSPSNKNNNNAYFGGGLLCQGPSAARPDDALGLGFARANLLHAPGGSETSIELTYHLRICDQLYLQPDIQYFVHPGGTERVLDNALVAFIRFNLEI